MESKRDQIDALKREVAEHKRAEEAAGRLAAIVESSADAIISKTLGGIITSWNKGAERIFGYLAEEAIGRPISLLIPPDRGDEEPAILDRIRRGENIRSYETVRMRKDGALIDISLTVSPITNTAGRIVGASKIARDITEQKRIERALAEVRESLRQHADDLEKRVQERTASLQESVRSLDSFCYSMAHDLRAPLRAMMGFSAELKEQHAAALDERGQDCVERIQSAAGRMDQLILDLLQFGRLNSIALPLATVELGSVIGKALVPLELEIRRRRAQVRLRTPLQPVRASPVILDQVLANLLSNALKFVPSGVTPQVEIWTEEHADMVRVQVRDNGIGIKPNYIRKLFQPFVRLVNLEDYPGTGIGLAIVRKGVERMGGRVGVESQYGQGSCFWIELPKGLPESVPSESGAGDTPVAEAAAL